MADGTELNLTIVRLGADDSATATTLFRLMAEVFEEEECQELSSAYVRNLLAHESFWAIAARVGDRLIGGLTAHTLPMTRSPSSELFIYDIAVVREFQRKGVGRKLVTHLATEAGAQGINNLFVPADQEDTHALDSYRALGGKEAPVSIFTFTSAGLLSAD